MSSSSSLSSYSCIICEFVIVCEFFVHLRPYRHYKEIFHHPPPIRLARTQEQVSTPDKNSCWYGFPKWNLKLLPTSPTIFATRLLKPITHLNQISMLPNSLASVMWKNLHSPTDERVPYQERWKWEYLFRFFFPFLAFVFAFSSGLINPNIKHIFILSFEGM